nr:hypothetical protein [Tanacetum cinerariifolium]
MASLEIHSIVPAFLKELIDKVHGLQVLLMELSRFEIPLAELELSQDIRLSQVLLQSPWMIKLSPSIGMWTTFSFNKVRVQPWIMVFVLTKFPSAISILQKCSSPPPAQVYSSPKKDLSWSGLPEFVDDTVTDYSRPTPSIDESKCNTRNNFSVSENGESSGSIMSMPMIKFVKAADCPRVTKTNNTENDRKSTVKYAEMYRNTTKSLKGNINDKGYWDSGCSRHMTCNISYLSKYEPYDGGYVSFGQGGGKITSKGIIKTGKLEFKNVYFVKDLNFKLKDDTNVLLSTPRQHNMYSIDLNNIVPHKNLTCLVAKALIDESMLWHRRLGHLNFKTMNKLVRNNLVRGFPSKCFKNDHTCVAYLKDHLGKFNAIGDEGYFVRYSMSSKAFRVFNKRTKKVEENMHVDFLENKLIEKGVGPYWLFDIDTLTNSRNYVPVVVVGTSSTNISETKNSNGCNADDPKSSRISNPTATLKIPSVEQVEHVVSLTMETKIPTVSSPVPTVCLDITSDSSSDARIISKGVFRHEETPSLGNALTLSNRFEDTFGEEADLRVRPIGTKWVLKNMKDKRGIVIRNKARIEAIRLFLAYASFMGFIVYQMDVKSAFLYGTIDEDVYVMQPSGFQDPEFPNRVYKVEKAMYGLHQALRACLQVLQNKDGIFLSQDMYVGDILKKFGYSDVRGGAEPTQEDAPIKGGIIEIGEEVGAEKCIELGSNDTEEIINVLSSIEAANILTSGVAATSVSAAAGVSTAGVLVVSGSFPTANAIFTTASM